MKNRKLLNKLAINIKQYLFNLIFIRKRLFTLLCLLVFSQAAFAQSAPPPFGVWQSSSGYQSLVVNQNGTCGFQGIAPGTKPIEIAGRCTWDFASSRGGILTIIVSNYPRDTNIRFSIVWVDQNHITSFGDDFYRMQ